MQSRMSTPGRFASVPIVAAATVIAVLLVMAASANAAVNPRFKDNPPNPAKATLTTGSSGGGVAPLYASNRYTISGVNWAPERNTPGGYVMGVAKNGDVFDVSDYNGAPWYGGNSFRVHCGFILSNNLLNQNTSGANINCNPNGTSIPESQFAALENCVHCGNYDTTTWTSSASAAYTCLDLTVPPAEITSSNHASCRDASIIYKGDTIGWRYATKDYQWVEIKDLRYGEGDGAYMFVQNNGTLGFPCNTGTGCNYNP